jgi:hypothetical protein
MAKSKTEATTKKVNGDQPARRPAPARPRTTTKKKAAAAGAAAQPEPSREEIAKLAYELYLQRGGVDGSHVEDWLEAERLLKSRS